MVLFGLTVIISENNPTPSAAQPHPRSWSRRCCSRRWPGLCRPGRSTLVLVATNVLRGIASIGLILVGDHLLLLILLNLFISTVTVFFAPAEAAMIPEVVPRRQLLSANGVFTLTLNAAFALGFASSVRSSSTSRDHRR